MPPMPPRRVAGVTAHLWRESTETDEARNVVVSEATRAGRWLRNDAASVTRPLPAQKQRPRHVAEVVGSTPNRYRSLNGGLKFDRS